MKLKVLSFLALIGIATGQEAITSNESVRQQFGYVELGLGPMPVPLPVFGIGGKSQWNHHGLDVSAQVATVGVVTAVQANFLYNYYFKPNLASQFYIGAGVAPNIVFGRELFGRYHHGNNFGLGFSPELVFGKQYRNESQDIRFFQAQINFPTWLTDKRHDFNFNDSHLLKFPIVTLNYGIGF
jgi:hypothetical protein